MGASARRSTGITSDDPGDQPEMPDLVIEERWGRAGVGVFGVQDRQGRVQGRGGDSLVALSTAGGHRERRPELAAVVLL